MNRVFTSLLVLHIYVLTIRIRMTAPNVPCMSAWLGKEISSECLLEQFQTDLLVDHPKARRLMFVVIDQRDRDEEEAWDEGCSSLVILCRIEARTIMMR